MIRLYICGSMLVALLHAQTTITNTYPTHTINGTIGETISNVQTPLGIINVKDYGAAGDGTTDDTANLQLGLTAAAALNEVAYFPHGTYVVSGALEAQGAVRCAEGAIIKATASIPAVMRFGSASPVVDGFLRGCIINANGLAADGVIFRQYQHFQLDDTEVFNAVTNMFHFGDSTLPGSSYEMIAKSIHSRHTIGAITAVGILVDSNATDANISHSVISGIATGIKALTGGNFFTDVHVWTAASAGWMVTGFDDYGVGNIWKGCESDTAETYGFHGESTATNTVIQGGRMYVNNIYGQDNISIGIQIDAMSSYDAISGVVFQGADATHRMATDISTAGSLTQLNAVANTDVNVVNQNQVGININGNASINGSVFAQNQLVAAPPANATAAQNNRTNLQLGANYWNGTSSSAYAWNINTNQPTSGYANSVQLYFYAAGALPPGITPTIVYGTNAATASANSNSLLHLYQSSYWNGTSGVYDNWTIQAKTAASYASGGAAPYSQFVFSHPYGTSGPASVAMPALTLNSDYTMSNSPRMHWDSFGVCSPAYSNCYESALWTPGKSIQITQWTLNFQSAPAGCATYPVLAIVQGATTIATIQTSASTADYAANISTPIDVSSSNGALRIVNKTAGSGCSNYGSSINSTVEYVMQ